MKKFKICDLGDVITGTTPPSKYSDNWGSAASFLTPTDISEFDYFAVSDKKISEDTLRRYKTRIVPPGSIAVVCIGATIGKLAYVREPTLTNQQINSIVPKQGLVDPKYLFYKFQLLSSSLKRIAGGSATPLLVKSDFERIEIEVHDIAEQRSIGTFFAEIDSLIHKNRQILSALKQLLETTYAHWFVSFEFPNKKGNPYISHGGDMDFSEKLQRDIPKDWTAERIENHFKFDKGWEPGASSYSGNRATGAIPFFRVSDIPISKPVFVSDSLTSLKVFSDSDILVTFDGTVGKILFGKHGAYSSAMRKIYSKDNIHSNGFVYSVMSSLHVQQSIHRYSTGSVLLHAGESIKHLYMPFNPEIVKKFDDVASRIFSRMVEIAIETENLEEFKNTLLPQMMNNWATT